MGTTQYRTNPNAATGQDRLCWREVLFGVFADLYPVDQQLEHMLDHLERTP